MVIVLAVSCFRHRVTLSTASMVFQFSLGLCICLPDYNRPLDSYFMQV